MVQSLIQVFRLTGKLFIKEKGNGQLDLRDEHKHSNALAKETVVDPMSNVPALVVKHQQEDLSSAKSDVFDSESPRYTSRMHSSVVDQDDSARAFETDQSDSSQDDDENFSKNMLSTANLLGKDADDDYPATSSNLSYFGFPVEDQGFGFWTY